MSATRNIPNDGQALTTPDVQRIGDVAASADDRVFENVLTPGSVQKKIIPTSEESPTVNPRLLVVPGAVAGTVQVQPCFMVAGSPSKALAVALAATLQSALATAAFAANASGATRYDLVYATVQRTVSLTGLRVFKSTADGSLSNQTANLADAPAVTLTILPNVGNVTPLATMPADNNGGANGEPFGSYNFPLALVALPNGYALNGAIAQSIITQMWQGGFLAQHRVRGMRPMSIYYGAAVEKPNSPALTAQIQNAERLGSDERFFSHFVVTTTAAVIPAAGDLLDNSIDWRNRFLVATMGFLGSASASLPLETTASTALYTTTPLVGMGFSGPGAPNSNVFQGFVFDYVSAGNGIIVYVDTAGALRIAKRGTAPTNGANGDLVFLVISASDKIVSGA